MRHTYAKCTQQDCLLKTTKAGSLKTPQDIKSLVIGNPLIVNDCDLNLYTNFIIMCLNR